jgi:Arm DNA-binding domain
LTNKKGVRDVADRHETRPLTDRTVKALKAGPGERIDRVDGTVPWLTIRVTENRKTWTLGYRIGKRPRRWTLGTYPTLTVAAARKKARAALVQLDAKGIDPGRSKRDARSRETVGDLAVQYLEAAKLKKKSWAQDEMTLNANVLPAWKHRAVVSITRRDCKALLAR